MDWPRTGGLLEFILWKTTPPTEIDEIRDGHRWEPIEAQVVLEPRWVIVPPRRLTPPPRVFAACIVCGLLREHFFLVPLMGFLGRGGWGPRLYSLSIMTILLCHEAGHFVQTLRYRVYASLPYFIPFPGSPIGTLGAVIGMEARVGDRKAVFDMGITGPLAGLVPTLIFTVIGLAHVHLQPTSPARQAAFPLESH